MTRPRRVSDDRLTDDQMSELMSEMIALINGRSAFATSMDRKEAWRRHEKAVRRRYEAEYDARHRAVWPHPRAFYAYDAPPDERQRYTV